MEPTMKRIRMSRPYGVHPATKQIFSMYQVMVTWPDGTREKFDSEEQAKAKIEGRSVNQSAIDAEIPTGAVEAFQSQTPDPEPEPEPDKAPNEFDVVLLSFNDKKVAVIKAIRQITGIGLKESKALVESAPVKVREAICEDDATIAASLLRTAGATVEVK
jgi:large subunit ribosomal protein L7/L12